MIWRFFFDTEIHRLLRQGTFTTALKNPLYRIFLYAEAVVLSSFCAIIIGMIIWIFVSFHGLNPQDLFGAIVAVTLLTYVFSILATGVYVISRESKKRWKGKKADDIEHLII